MAVLLELMDYFDRKQKEEVMLETQRRAQNRLAEQEGKRKALEGEYLNTFKEIQQASRTEQSLVGSYQKAVAEKTLTPELKKMYDDARFANNVKLQSASDKMGAIQLERDLMTGKVDKKTASAYTSVFDNLYKPDKDPYDQIKEERISRDEQDNEVRQSGPASAFMQMDQERMAQATQASTSMFGSYYGPEESSVQTPEISYRPVRNQGGVTAPEDVAGATEVDPTSTLPNPNPVAAMVPKPVTGPVKQDGVVRVRNKATGQTGSMPIGNANRAVESGEFEIIQ